MATRITAARLGAAHDGVAELIITIGYDNGGRSELALDAAASNRLMSECGAKEMAELIGHDWRKVRDALSHQN